MIPVRLTSPTVGLMPTMPLMEEGLTIEPSVSVPTATVQRLAVTAAAEPELEPDVFLSSAYGFLVSPPLPLHPLVEWFERMFAHSLRFVFPSMTAPARRSCFTRNASAGGFEPTSASEPAVVAILSVVSTLSLMRTGMPCSGPRGPFSFLSLSRPSAIERASGFSSITLLSRGPCLSIAPIWAMYDSVIERAVYLPDFIPSARSPIVFSSRSEAWTPRSGGGGGEVSPLRIPPGSAAMSIPPESPVLIKPLREIWPSCPPVLTLSFMDGFSVVNAIDPMELVTGGIYPERP